jgi:hypothetical protein
MSLRHSFGGLAEGAKRYAAIIAKQMPETPTLMRTFKQYA